MTNNGLKKIPFLLNIIRKITSSLPCVRGVGFIILKTVIPISRKLFSSPYITPIHGYLMNLDLKQNIDSKLFFIPQIYDSMEVRFLKKTLRPNFVFIDIGGHIGFYTLLACQLMNDEGTILTVEADPANYEKLKYNLHLNNFNMPKIVNMGVSDKSEVLKLFLNTSGNTSGNTFLDSFSHRPHVEVNTIPLSNLIKENNITHIDVMKIDIEGFEYRALKEFFINANRSVWPKYIITEYHEIMLEDAGGNVLELLEQYDYSIIESNKLNYIFERKS